MRMGVAAEPWARTPSAPDGRRATVRANATSEAARETRGANAGADGTDAATRSNWHEQGFAHLAFKAENGAIRRRGEA